MKIRVFVENEAGSNRKNYHDEKTLTYRNSQVVSHAYPFPYGFIIGTESRAAPSSVWWRPLSTCSST